MQMIIALVKRDNLARHVRTTDVVAIQLANQVAEKVLVTDICFLTESMTELDSCCKEIVSIDLLECCLGNEFNLLTGKLPPRSTTRGCWTWQERAE